MLSVVKIYTISMKAQPGTYALIMTCDSDQQVEVGKLGRFNIKPGSYVYVGSAFGPGGLKARIAHHIRMSHRPHWHMDYLRPILKLKEVCYSYHPERHEHRWAGAFNGFKGASVPIIGFGASDCSCPSHLFRFSRKPSDRLLRRKLKCHLMGCRQQPGVI